MELSPSKLDAEDIEREIEQRRESNTRNTEFISYITTGICLINKGHNKLIENLLEDEIEIVSNFREKDQQALNNKDLSDTFPMSIELWNASMSRKYSKDNPTRGFDMINSYIESNNAELSIRYINIYKENFLEQMYERIRIEDKDMLQKRQNMGDNKFRERVLYGCLLICAWHKMTGILIPEQSVDSSNDYIVL
jgi:phosphoribosyl-ATP pyrophosphohydrolase